MKASSFSWISRTFSVKRNANVSKSYTNKATISMAKNYHFISPALYLTAFTSLLKFNLLLGKPLTWPHHCKEALSSGLMCIQIFLGFPADKVSSRVKCHCGYILCHSNSRWWPPTVPHSKVRAVEEQMMRGGVLLHFLTSTCYFKACPLQGVMEEEWEWVTTFKSAAKVMKGLNIKIQFHSPFRIYVLAWMKSQKDPGHKWFQTWTKRRK